MKYFETNCDVNIYACNIKRLGPSFDLIGGMKGNRKRTRSDVKLISAPFRSPETYSVCEPQFLRVIGEDSPSALLRLSG